MLLRRTTSILITIAIAAISVLGYGEPSVEPTIAFVHPTPHTIFQIDSRKNSDCSFQIQLTRFRLPEDGVIRIQTANLDVRYSGLMNTTQPDIFDFVLNNVHPGTYFLTAQLIRMHRQSKTEWNIGSPAQIHFEVVWKPHILDQLRSRLHSFAPLQEEALKKVIQNQKKIKICYFVGSGPFDGITKLSLLQIRNLPSDVFDVCVITFAPLDELHPRTRLSLLEAAVPIHSVPLVVSEQDAQEHGLTPANLESHILRYAPTEHYPNFNSSTRETQRRPMWAKTIWQELLGVFHASDPDIFVFSNSRRILDRVLTTATKMQSIVSVMEIPNIDPKPVFPVPDAIITPSRYTLARVLENAEFPTSSETRVIHPGVNSSAFHSLELTRRPTSTTTVGFIGRLAVGKSIGLILSAAVQVLATRPDTRFLILGSGDQHLNLRKLALELNLSSDQVMFQEGVFDPSKLYPVFRELDVFLNPSLVEETFCIANVEAMAAGVPVVGFATGGVSEYLSHGVNGLWVNDTANASHAFAHAILEVLDNSTWAQEMGQNAQRLVRAHLGLERMIDEYARFYQHLASTLEHSSPSVPRAPFHESQVGIAQVLEYQVQALS